VLAPFELPPAPIVVESVVDVEDPVDAPLGPGPPVSLLLCPHPNENQNPAAMNDAEPTKRPYFMLLSSRTLLNDVQLELEAGGASRRDRVAIGPRARVRGPGEGTGTGYGGYLQ